MITALRTLARDVVRSSRGHDLPLAGQLAGATSVRELGTSLASVVPDQAGARQATRFLANAGTRLTPSQVLAAPLPASVYGEGSCAPSTA